MMSSRPILAALATAFAAVSLLLPAGASAHATLTIEKDVGEYYVQVQYFGDAAFAREEVRFKVYFAKKKGSLVKYDAGAFSIAPEGGTGSVKGSLEVTDAGAFFAYTFPTSGSYVMNFTFSKGGRVLAEVPLDIYVYDIPELQGAEEIATETTSSLLPLISGAAILAFLACGVAYFRRKP
jgi:hypothetical protein